MFRVAGCREHMSDIGVNPAECIAPMKMCLG